MSQPDDGRREPHESGLSAQDSLRVRLLSDAVGNCLPMAQVTSVMTREDLADTPAAQ